MQEKVAVRVTNIRKEFILPQHKNTSLKQAFVNIRRRNNRVVQTVLDGVTFDVQKGDFFGVVGRNGSGKSTLLKLLAGVYTPTSGGIEMHGKLTPFIELGVGFNPELSGRDNVFLNGALLGFDYDEMAAMYEDIVDFAELAPFMDQKLKNYSSGMQVRLAFSIAIKAKNDILIFDEVLAVGDEAFQQKCINVFETYKRQKQTVILVTHDMEMVKKFCNRAMLLNAGKIVEIGDPRKVASIYSKLNQQEIDRTNAKDAEPEEKAKPKYLKARVLDVNGNQKNRFEHGERLLAEVTWDGLPADRIESIGVNIFKRSGEHITGINTRFTPHDKNWKEKAKISIEYQLNMTPGQYFLLIEAFEQEGKAIDAILEGPKFSISPADIKWSGLMELPHKWHES